MVNVMNVQWYEFPKKDWVRILDAIPSGTYIRDLPYATLPYAPTLRIPCEPDFASMGWRTMDFTKHRGQDGSWIWRKDG